MKVLREEGIDAVRYVLWDATGWHHDYSPHAWRNRATEEQKLIGWEMAVRMEKIIAIVLHEAHRLQVDEPRASARILAICGSHFCLCSSERKDR